MSVEFTPGPWRLNGPNKEQVSCGEQGRGYVVAEAMGLTHSSHAEAEANARLIAAAPGMYKALRHIRSLIPKNCAAWGSEQEIADTADNALAKIGGNQ